MINSTHSVGSVYLRQIVTKKSLVIAALLCLPASAAAQETYPVLVPAPPETPPARYERLSVSARDGAKIVVHEWAPAARAKDAGKPVVLFMHGIGMHGEAYSVIQAGFSARNLTLVVPDLRGHGHSGGNRGEMAEPHVIRADLGTVIALIQRRHPGAPVVLGGESMGALIAADYAWRGEQRLAGLGLLVPAFAVHPSQVRLDALFAAAAGKVPLATDARLQASTREPRFIRARQADKLALPEVKTSYLLALGTMQQEWPRAAPQLKLPLFVGVAGKDCVINTKIAREVYDRAGTAKADKTWRQWDDAYHTLCWDPLTPQVVEEFVSWVLRVPPPTE
jgi:alpha-beta hydrolase superfamily lysophospholipase